MGGKIPVTVLITTLNEEKNLPRCLAALERFDEIIVIDSNSADATAQIAESFGVKVVPFTWNGQYPKKRQWCLDTLSLKHDRVFFIDADEVATPDLCDEIAGLDWKADGYFVRGLYVIDGEVVRFGFSNKKLCLFDRRRMCFPVVDDLDIPGMGEIEGHYQPVAISGKVIQKALKAPVLHYALDDRVRHRARHENYALWRAGVLERNALPQDSRFMVRWVKKWMQGASFKSLYLILYYGVFKLGLMNYEKYIEIYRAKRLYLRA